MIKKLDLYTTNKLNINDFIFNDSDDEEYTNQLINANTD
jgi:hypothetical protein